MKNNQDNILQEHFNSIAHLYPGLTLVQYQKYWLWFEEIFSIHHPYLDRQSLFEQWQGQTLQGKPIAYILNQWAFYRDTFFISEDVLIPRPETEIMVEQVLQAIPNLKENISEPLKIAEIGVGSGAVILSILKYSSRSLLATLTDISNEAMQCCYDNYQIKKHYFSQPHQVDFLIGDRTLDLPTAYYDLIVCNPPYIPQGHAGVHPQVHQWEPHQALYLPKQRPLEWTLELIDGITACLKPGGMAWIEGHEDLLPEISKKISSKVKVNLMNDYNQRPRFLKIEK